MPVTVLYLGNFKLIQNLKAAVEKRLGGSDFKPIAVAAKDDAVTDSDEESQKKAEAAEAQLNEPLSMDAVKNVLSIVGVPILNLSAVGTRNYVRCISLSMPAPPVLQKELIQRLRKLATFGTKMRLYY